MDIDKLEAGPELDALVAEKVMGWNVHFVEPELRNGREHWRDPVHNTLYLPSQWCPSGDIAAAWEVVEKVVPGPQGFNLYLSSAWQASFAGGTAVARTAPLAICRAALKAVGA